MSQPYKSKALKTMTKAIERKLWQEKQLLWRARNLHRIFLGDSRWMPCGKVETPDDRYLFESRIVNGEAESSSATGPEQSRIATPAQVGVSEPRVDGVVDRNGQGSRTADADVEMADAPLEPNNDANEKDTKKPKSEDADAMIIEPPRHEQDASEGPSNGPISEDKKSTESKEGQEEDEHAHDGSSPEPPRRMTTRAQTNAANPHQDNDSLNHSPSPSTDAASTLPSVHPLFLVPESIRQDPTFGLPPNEAEETRRLLWSYIQKQEETVRGFEHMFMSLLRAYQMKDEVFEWCKAEGHLHEMSDGEDWYDGEKWGLAEGEYLKKGADEDEVVEDDTRTTGKRGRKRN